jgi:hypothetical protein
VAFACKLSRGATVVADFAPCTSPHAYDLGSRPDGDYTFQVVALDGAGNSSAAALSAYALDATSPGAPVITSGPGGTGNDPAVTWAFAGEAGAAFECRLAGVTGWAPCSSPQAYDLAAEPDGTFTFSVRARDAVGNTSPAASEDFLLDRTAPSAPTIDAYPASPARSRAPRFAFSADAGATVECRLERSAGPPLADWAACDGARTYDLGGEPDGGFIFRVRARDVAGNTSAPSNATYVLDTTAPATPAFVTTPGVAGRDRTPSWSFSGDMGTTFECRLTIGGDVVSDWSFCADPRTFNLGGLPDGTYQFAVRGTDPAGNTSAPARDSYRLDTTAPGTPLLAGGPPALGSDATPAWRFSVDPDATAECRLEGERRVVSHWAPCSSPAAFDLTGERDGDFRLRVRATDAVGLTGPDLVVDYTLDTAAPSAPVLSDGPGAVGNARRPAWSVSAEPGAIVICRLTRGGAVIADWAPCGTPARLDLRSAPDGAYRITVRAIDGAGNESPLTTALYVLDTTAPAAPVITGGPGASGVGRQVAWAFAGEPGARYHCRLLRDGTVVSGWAGCTSPRAYDLVLLPTGVYTFVVVALDAVGNRSVAATGSYELVPPAGPPAEPPPPPAEPPPPPSGPGPPPPAEPAPPADPGPPAGDPQPQPDPAPSGAGDGRPADDDPSATTMGAGAPAPAPGEPRRPDSGGPPQNAIGEFAPPAGGRLATEAPEPRAPRAGRRPDDPDPVLPTLRQLGQVATAVAANADKAAFPFVLLVMVALFLAVQNRIDRRDPKLALAPVRADEELEFSPPPKP